MVSDNSPYGLLIVSASDKFAESIREITAHYRFEGFRTVATCGEARRSLMEGNFDALIVNTPAGDEFGCDFATDMALNTNVGVLLLVRNEIYEEVFSKTLQSGVMVLPKPLNRSAFCLSLELLGAQAVRLRRAESEKKKLEAKLEEVRVVSRAKCLLMENMNISENDAHKYIERQAMNSRKSRREFSEEILRLYLG